MAATVGPGDTRTVPMGTVDPAGSRTRRPGHDDPDPAMAQTAMVVTVSSPDLEARLGWILPDTVHAAIQSGRSVLPAPADSTTGPTGRRVPEPLELLESDDSRRPAPSHRVHIPGRPTET
ncbi:MULTISPECIES: hypothetical protein [unclassified Frankia]|uniref:hypothetical protein n=1 Tax=unclassified Frankia TaxID=2632575 RepID=UPI002AD41875|nr:MULTISPECIES: hypothetical protein [unclassified Frankia]